METSTGTRRWGIARAALEGTLMVPIARIRPAPERPLRWFARAAGGSRGIVRHRQVNISGLAHGDDQAQPPCSTRHSINDRRHARTGAPARTIIRAADDA